MGGPLEYCFCRQSLNPKYFDRSSIKKENVRIEGRKNMIIHSSIREKMQKNAKKKKNIQKNSLLTSVEIVGDCLMDYQRIFI